MPQGRTGGRRPAREVEHAAPRTRGRDRLTGFGLELPERSSKPRGVGLTLVIDRGYGWRTLADLLDSSAEFVDYVKFGWGTGPLSRSLDRKIELLRQHDVGFFFGGTLLEAFLLQDNLDGFRRFLDENDPPAVEVSDGIVEFRPGRKEAIIELLRQDRKVFSEVGKKRAEQDLTPVEWVRRARSELEAGAWKVVCESRESGGVGIFSETGDLRESLVQEIIEGVLPEDLVFEAPIKSAQAWLVNRLGPNVNLGNIAVSDVIPLETLRLGLRADTLPTGGAAGNPRWLVPDRAPDLGGEAG